MIINPLSVSALTLDGLSLGLSAVTAAGTLFMLPAMRKTPASGEQMTIRENRLYLLFWMGAVLLILRFASWPMFYYTLHSFIPEIEGAMCIFGVRNLLPTLTRLVEILKPLLFFLGLVWLVLFRFERFGAKNSTIGRQGQAVVLILLLLCSLSALTESFCSVWLWLQSSAELAVSCCTTVTDIPDRFTVWIPQSLLGSGYSQLLWYLFFGMNLLLIAQGILCQRKMAAQAQSTPLWLWLLFVLTLLNMVTGLFSFIEVIAPRLMGLPFHHCMYCMVQKVADGPLLMALFVVGNFAFAACLPVFLVSRKWTKESVLHKGIQTLLFIGLLGVSGSAVMVAAHLLAERIGGHG